MNLLQSLGGILISKLRSFIRDEYRHIDKEKFRNSLREFPPLSE